MYHSNIKILDLSHNNISLIHPGYFRPAESSLTHLHLGYNSLMVITKLKINEMDFLIMSTSRMLLVMCLAI